MGIAEDNRVLEVEAQQHLLVRKKRNESIINEL